MEKRGQFTFYRSFMEAMMDFPREEWLGYLLAVMEYGLDRKLPKGLSSTQRGMFKFVKPNLDASWKRAISGSNGGKISKRGSAKKISKGKKEKKIEIETEIETETETESESFTAFWERYPVKLGRQDALAQWVCVCENHSASDVMQGLENWLASENWKKENGRFIPKAEKWLREGWWQENPKQAVPMGTPGQLGEAELEAIKRLLQE